MASSTASFLPNSSSSTITPSSSVPSCSPTSVHHPHRTARSHRIDGRPPFTSQQPAIPIQIRCETDPIEPLPGACLARITTDDRQGVSHFFGRNKRATASIPESMFPLLCRTHYQEKAYRFDDGAFAGLQCDCILKTLERMGTGKWVDSTGREWGWWCGFELQSRQVCNTTTSRDDLGGKGKAKAQVTIKHDKNIVFRKHRVKETAPVPEWLKELCTRNDTKNEKENYISIGDRNGVRYNFPQLIQIVKTIKTWCVQHNAQLPTVEALPITIGMLNESDYAHAKAGLRVANRTKKTAADTSWKHVVKKLETGSSNSRRLEKQARDARSTFEHAVELVEQKKRNPEMSSAGIRRDQSDDSGETGK